MFSVHLPFHQRLACRGWTSFTCKKIYFAPQDLLHMHLYWYNWHLGILPLGSSKLGRSETTMRQNRGQNPVSQNRNSLHPTSYCVRAAADVARRQVSPNAFTWMIRWGSSAAVLPLWLLILIQQRIPVTEERPTLSHWGPPNFNYEIDPRFNKNASSLMQSSRKQGKSSLSIHDNYLLQNPRRG